MALRSPDLRLSIPDDSTVDTSARKVICTMTSVIRTALILSGVLLWAAGAANAQTLDRMTFTTSFSFVAAGKTMPAGTYSIEQVSDVPGAIVLTDGQHRLALMEVDAAASPEPGAGRIETEAVFTKLENGTYALDQLWNEGDQAGVQIAWTALRVPMEPASPAGAPHTGRIVPATIDRR